MLKFLLVLFEFIITICGVVNKAYKFLSKHQQANSFEGKYLLIEDELRDHSQQFQIHFHLYNNGKFKNGKKCSEVFVNNNKYGGTWIYGWAMYNLHNIAAVIVLFIAISIGLNFNVNEENQ